jgi:anti-anti-sigma factor
MKTIPTKEVARFSEAIPGDALEVEVEEPAPSIVVMRLHRELDSDSGDDLARHLSGSVVQAAQFVILDLAGLHSLDEAELQVLVDFRRTLSAWGGEVWLAGLQPAVWLALHRANRDRLFTIRDSVAQALAS